MRVPYPETPTRGTLVKRYKRFLSDVRLDDGSEVVAHCGNPGSMMGLAEPGSRVWLTPNRNKTAKLDWRWEIATQETSDGPVAVGINTSLANTVVEAALRAGAVADLAGYADIRREVKYGSRNSRIDFLLSDPARPDCYVEVKSVTLRRPDGPAPEAAEFPDARTERGAKHLAELADMARSGARAVMFYLVQRADCAYFTIASDIDPAYAEALDAARAAGVEIICHDCVVSPKGVELKSLLPVRI
jgi:sugar fermentation stimulation protein A